MYGLALYQSLLVVSHALLLGESFALLLHREKDLPGPEPRLWTPRGAW